MRLGVLGGTFDPVHLGHLLVAEQAREALALDRVLLIPAARPPHKPEAPIAAFADRLRMVALARDGCDHLLASDLEADPLQPSFTVDTLRRLRASTPELGELWLLVGSDSIADLPGWRDPREILRLARLAVYPRPREGEDERSPGNGPESPDRESPEEAASAPASVLSGVPVRRLEGPRLRLSSTEIRERVRSGRSIRFLVPEAVRAYILERGLYRGGAPAGPGLAP